MTEQLYKFSGLLGFTIVWSGMLYVVHKQGRDKTKSISLHAAATRDTFLLLAVLSPLSMGLFIIFCLKWLAPSFELSLSFVILTTLANLGYIFAAWVPAGRGIKGKLHDLFAYGASLLLIPITFTLATSANIATLSKAINALACLVMVSIFAVMSMSRAARSTHLYFQIAYFMVFDFSLLATGYL
jgi:hypothetical protein